MRCFVICLLSCLSLMSSAETAPMLETLHLDWFEPDTSLQHDFYAHANGRWKKNNPIPPDYASWGSFSVLEEQNMHIIHQMLEDIIKTKPAQPGSVEQKVGDFYYSGMDTSSINRLGATPLATEFANIDAIHDQSTLQAEIAHLHRMGVGVLFDFGSMQDFKDSSRMIAAVSQGGLSLPDRDYYLKNDKKFVTIRKQFVQHITKMMGLLGETKAAASHAAQTILKIETTLAQASMTQIEQRDPDAIYHMLQFNQLSELTPHFSWTDYFKAMGVPEVTEVNMAMPGFMKAVNQALVQTSLADWQTYLRWHLLSEASAYLSKPFLEESFRMHAQLTGVKSLPPRWKQVVGVENGLLGFAVGELYVKKYFSPRVKVEVSKMIKNIREVLRHDLQHLSWMSAATRQAAIKKLDLMQDRVGYPDKWRDYSTLHIDRGPYILNVLRASAFLVKRNLDKIGKPVDRNEWDMTPQTVNAYYDPSMNNINLPMGILQPPYFDPNAPASVNYGAIGAVIGHEITHGFDDQGAKFDDKGNLHNWWMPVDLKKFQEATQCIAEQFSQYKVNGNVPVQGKLVVGEATADLGGLSLSYRAFNRTEAYKTAPIIHGYTPDQQFFISYAHIWANNIRPEQAHNLIMIDPHPPTQYRVNGTLANMPEFKAAFGIPETGAMVNKKRCVVW